jgi:hypothetical protein
MEHVRSTEFNLSNWIICVMRAVRIEWCHVIKPRPGCKHWLLVLRARQCYMCSLSHTPLDIYICMVCYTVVHVLCYIILSHLSYVNEDILHSEWLYIHVVCTHVVTLTYSWDNFNNSIPHSKLQQETVLRRPIYLWGMQWRNWLRHYATNRKVSGLIPDEVIGFFNWPNPSAALWPWGWLSL